MMHYEQMYDSLQFRVIIGPWVGIPAEGWRMNRISKPRNRRTKNKSVTVKAAQIGGACVIVAAIITAVLPTILHGSDNGPSSSAETASPSAVPPPTTLTSSSGLTVQSSTFFEPGVDTSFVTQNKFEPTGQLAAALVNAPSIAYLSIFYNAGAINLAQTVLRLVFTGESQQGVRILNITPIILKRAAPWHGDLFYFPLQGEAPIIRTSLDVDDSFPTVTDSATDQPYFEEKTITLHQGEQAVVTTQVTATRGFVAFTLRVDYLVGTQQREITITNRGRPFELSAVNCIRKNFMSYSLVFSGLNQTLNDAQQPSQFQATCRPN